MNNKEINRLRELAGIKQPVHSKSKSQKLDEGVIGSMKTINHVSVREEEHPRSLPERGMRAKTNANLSFLKDDEDEEYFDGYRDEGRGDYEPQHDYYDNDDREVSGDEEGYEIEEDLTDVEVGEDANGRMYDYDDSETLAPGEVTRKAAATHDPFDTGYASPDYEMSNDGEQYSKFGAGDKSDSGLSHNYNDEFDTDDMMMRSDRDQDYFSDRDDNELMDSKQSSNDGICSTKIENGEKFTTADVLADINSGHTDCLYYADENQIQSLIDADKIDDDVFAHWMEAQDEMNHLRGEARQEFSGMQESDMDNFSASAESDAMTSKSDKIVNDAKQMIARGMDPEQVVMSLADEYGLSTEEQFDLHDMATQSPVQEGKPDFPDLDNDGDKEESMKKAIKDRDQKVDEDFDNGYEDQLEVDADGYFPNGAHNHVSKEAGPASATHGDNPSHKAMSVNESSSKRLITKMANEQSGKEAKVYLDREYAEYIVQFFDNGKYQREADYHTDDKDDAIGTAQMFLKREHNMRESADRKGIHQSLVSGYRTFKKS